MLCPRGKQLCVLLCSRGCPSSWPRASGGAREGGAALEGGGWVAGGLSEWGHCSVLEEEGVGWGCAAPRGLGEDRQGKASPHRAGAGRAARGGRSMECTCRRICWLPGSEEKMRERMSVDFQGAPRERCEHQGRKHCGSTLQAMAAVAGRWAGSPPSLSVSWFQGGTTKQPRIHQESCGLSWCHQEAGRELSLGAAPGCSQVVTVRNESLKALCVVEGAAKCCGDARDEFPLCSASSWARGRSRERSWAG